MVDTETVLLIDSFHFRFNNLRVKILNKRIKEYKRKLAFEGKRAQQGYKFYCRLKETLIEKYPDLIKWWNVIHAALLKRSILYLMVLIFILANHLMVFALCQLITLHYIH